MKRIFTLLTGMAMALLTATSCIYNWNPSDERNGNGGHTRYPENYVLSESSAQCWGKTYNESSVNYTLKLYSGRYGASGDFVGEGVELVMDILCAPSNNLQIPAGTYNCTHNNYKPLYFLDGYEENGLFYPSYMYVKYLNGSTQLLCITGGSFSISYNNRGEMLFESRLKASDNHYYKFSFEGLVRIEDNSGQGGGSQGESDTKEYKLDFVAGASYYGKNFSETTDNYSLTLASGQYADNGDFVDKGVELAIDFLCQPSSTIALQTGRYICTYDDYAPMRFLEGFEAEDGTTYPTYIYLQYNSNGNYDLLHVIDGEINVSQFGTDYAIVADLVVNDGANSRYKFTYSGKINFIDDRGRSGISTKSGASREEIQHGRTIVRPRVKTTRGKEAIR